MSKFTEYLAHMNHKKVTLAKKSDATKSQEFELHKLEPEDLPQVLDFQDRIVEVLAKREFLVTSSKEEILESMELDFCFGLFDGDTMAALCILVTNRSGERSLYDAFKDVFEEKYGDSLSAETSITFDTIQVDPAYRGYGIQSYFLQVSEEMAKVVGAKCIIATVSPENFASKNNGVAAGYIAETTGAIHHPPYNGVVRSVMSKFIS